MKSDTAYWLAFRTVRGIGAVRYRKLIDYFGSLSLAWGAEKAELLNAGLTEKQLNKSHRQKIPQS